MNAHRQSSLVGQSIAGYELSATLGSGPHGQVFLATHRERSVACAFKVLDPNRCTRAVVRRSIDIHNTLAAVAGAGTCPLFDASDDPSLPFLVREYLGGDNLETLRRRGERVSWAVACPLFTAIARSLSAAHHASCVHGNLKPSNIRVLHPSTPGAAPTIRLLDWGLAQPSGHDEATRADLAANVDYQARELLVGGSPTPATDFYALGVLLFEALTGVRPFRGPPSEVAMQHMRAPAPSPRTIVSDLPHEAETLVLQLLHKDPQQRQIPQDWRAPSAGMDDGEQATAIFVRASFRPRPSEPKPDPSRQAGGEHTVVNATPGVAVQRQPDTILLPAASPEAPAGGVTLILEQNQGSTLLDPDTERSQPPPLGQATAVGPQSTGTVFIKTPSLPRPAPPTVPPRRNSLMAILSSWKLERKLIAFNIFLLILVIIVGVALYGTRS